ncbi:hypothetical protein M431DRAFT_506746 [Trichoderma harzianum CBS 226.95]|uniref:JmjC domain-containing protein n=1 Tax=Trichoderma harzianum CBS 226.95 TaxID=983964 RepID=A0A2T4AIY3_TRIHA|nr:hypothetical protein M431DRAFT_506746 [Trichoderma harzianum CBS 226.95]PTB57007.1 hypothetical protein M431DRAFT_506746 [Trichoderma harzianum CBS 226.95]
MDLNRQNLESYASSLRLLICSMNNLEELATFIIPDNDREAGSLLYSLQIVQSRLESWAASSHLATPPGLDNLSWTPQLRQSLFPVDAPDPTILSDTRLWDPNPIISTNTPSTSASVFDVASANDDNLSIAIATNETHQKAPSVAGKLSTCTTDPSTVRGGGLQSATTLLAEQAASWPQVQGNSLRPLISTPASSISQSSPGSSQTSNGGISQPCLYQTEFIIQRADASGGGILHYLTEIIFKDSFRNLVHIESLPRLSWNALVLPDNGLNEYHYCAVMYQAAYDQHLGNFTKLLVADEIPEFQLPSPSEVADQRPADESYTLFLESLALYAPQELVPYLVGPPLSSNWNDFVYAGEGLRSQLPNDIKGITTPYWYLGGKFAGTAFHKEDCDLRSMEVVIYGYRLWMIISTQDTKRFEEWVRRFWGENAGHSDQWLRRLNLILPPSMLKAANIEFNLICAGPGDMVVTSPNQYHYVINMTTSLAAAVNFLLPGEMIAGQPTTLCENCDFYPLVGLVPNLCSDSNQAVTKRSCKRPSTQPELGHIRKRHQQSKTVDTIWEHTEHDENARRAAVIKKLQAPPASCLIPIFQEGDLPCSKIVRLAMAMRGHSAISQVWRLYQSNNNSQFTNIRAALIDRTLTGNTQKMALDKGIIICTGATQQSNLLRRLLTWHFSEAVELTKGPTSIRVSSAAVTQYAGESPRSRYSKLKYRGDILHMICGSHRGLLPFIPLQRDDDCGIRDPESQYQNSATKKEFKDFEKIFQSNDVLTQVLCAIGTSFLDSWGYKNPCQFKYNDWLRELHRDFNEKLVQSMSDNLGRGVCGCSHKQKIAERPTLSLTET